MVLKSRIPQFFGLSVTLHLVLVVFSIHVFKIIKLSSSHEKVLVPIGVYVKYKKSGEELAKLAPKKIVFKKDLSSKNAIPEKKKEIFNKTFDVGNSKVGEDKGIVGDPNGIEVGHKERFKYELKLFIENNKEYPRLAQKQGQEGQVKVSFIINRDGTITDVRLLKTCPFARLNDATMNFFKRYSVFKQIPEEINEDRMELTYLIDYKLY